MWWFISAVVLAVFALVVLGLLGLSARTWLNWVAGAVTGLVLFFVVLFGLPAVVDALRGDNDNGGTTTVAVFKAADCQVLDGYTVDVNASNEAETCKYAKAETVPTSPSAVAFDVTVCNGAVDIQASVAAGKCVGVEVPKTFDVSSCSGVIDITQSITAGKCVAATSPTTPPQGGTVDACVDQEVHAGEKVFIASTCNVKGDVQVSDAENGTFTALYDSDPNTGLLVSCPNGCWVYAEWGANISPRNVDDLTAEMRSSGCDADGCGSVNHITWPDGSTTSNGTMLPAKPVGDACAFSIPNGQVMLVPTGCVVAGDIEVASSQNGPFTALYDSDQATGLVTVVSMDTWVKAPWGASVSSASVDDVVRSVDLTGCGLQNGCDQVHVAKGGVLPISFIRGDGSDNLDELATLVMLIMVGGIALLALLVFIPTRGNASTADDWIPDDLDLS